MYKNRIIIPPTILDALHAAHQGISTMQSRAESSICCWLLSAQRRKFPCRSWQIFKLAHRQKAKDESKGLINVLRRTFSTFNIPDEMASWHVLATREEVLRNRRISCKERLLLYTFRLPPLAVEDYVRVQNQAATNPTRWDKTGVIIEVKQFDQFSIRMDGSERITLQNRKFLSKFTPVNPRLLKRNISEVLRYSQKHRKEPIQATLRFYNGAISTANKRDYHTDKHNSPSWRSRCPRQNQSPMCQFTDIQSCTTPKTVNESPDKW